MFQQVYIWIPTMQLIVDLVAAYFLIGLIPWLAWCVSDVWRDYGKGWSKSSGFDYIRLIAAWSLWPISIDITRRNFKR